MVVALVQLEVAGSVKLAITIPVGSASDVGFEEISCGDRLMPTPCGLVSADQTSY
jgi:hypothetical protein